jgi:hypothetical protein
MLDVFRVGQRSVVGSPAWKRAARPTMQDGRRVPALRFVTPRVIGVALCACLHVVGGLTYRSFRAQVATLLGMPYSQVQMSCDLACLNTYVLTLNGDRVAIFSTKVCNRLLRPLIAVNAPPAPAPGTEDNNRLPR